MSDSDEIVFSQEPALSGETFVLRRDRIVVVGQIAGERHLPLADIAADIEMTTRRFTRFAIPVLGLFVVFGSAAWKVSGPTYWTAQVASLLFGSLAFSCLGALYVVLQPIPVARIRNKQGDVLFELYRHRNVALPFEEFLLQLRRRLGRPT